MKEITHTSINQLSSKARNSSKNWVWRLTCLGLMCFAFSSHDVALSEPATDTTHTKEPAESYLAVSAPLIGAAGVVAVPLWNAGKWGAQLNTGIFAKLSYVLAGLGAGVYVIHKHIYNNDFPSVWMSQAGKGFGDMQNSQANTSHNMDHFLQGEPDPKQVPLAPSIRNEDMRTKSNEDVASILATPTERLHLAVSLALYSFMPYVYDVLASSYDASDTKRHQEYLGAIMNFLLSQPDPGTTLWGSESYQTTTPTEVGSIYRSPHTTALLETYAILERIRLALDFSSRDMSAYLQNWKRLSVQEQTRYLSLSLSQDKEYAAVDQASATMLKSVMHLMAHSYQLFPIEHIQNVLNASPKDHSVQKHRSHTIALAKSLGRPNKVSLHAIHAEEFQALDTLFEVKLTKIFDMTPKTTLTRDEMEKFKRAEALKLEFFKGSYGYLRQIQYAAMDILESTLE